jgi:hypothetical protein
VFLLIVWFCTDLCRHCGRDLQTVASAFDLYSQDSVSKTQFSIIGKFIFSMQPLFFEAPLSFEVQLSLEQIFSSGRIF